MSRRSQDKSGVPATTREPISRAATDDRWFDVRAQGFDDMHTLRAPSRSAARYRSWKAATEAGYFTKRHGGLMAFAAACRVTLSDDQGDPRTPEYGVAP